MLDGNMTEGDSGMDVFSVFVNDPYNFLKVTNGTRGLTATLYPTSMGVFKLRDGMVTANNQETRTSSATLKIKPTEAFLAEVANNTVEHGIRIQGQDYRVIGQTAGDNYHTGVREHYRLTLERADYSDIEETS